MKNCLRLLLAGLVTAVALASLATDVAAQPEFRAFWVDAFHPGIKSPDEVDQMLSIVRATNCNAVVVQVRRRGDTYYPSPYEPWASDALPGFDGLAYLVQQAHEGTPRVEVHAWFCTLPVGASTDENHPFVKYPQYQTRDFYGSYDGDCFMDPGHPGALDYTTKVFLDVTRRYDVDGIHFDLVRFNRAGDGTPIYGYNEVSMARFNARFGRTGKPDPNDADWKQWRRDQITALVRRIYANAIAIRPHIKVSASTVTWGDGPADDDDWLNLSAAYTGVMQDWRSWMEEGILDLNIPMCYDREYNYGQRIYYENWIRFIKDHKYGRHAAIGPGIYLNTIEGTLAQIGKARLTTDAGNTADGICMFSYASTNDQWMDGKPYNDVPESDFYNALVNPSAYGDNPPFDTPVEVPDMPWKSTPAVGHIKGDVTANALWVDGASVTISGPESRSTVCDGTGFYAFVHLTPGSYTVSVTCDYGTESRVVTVTPGQVSTADFGFSAPVPVISNVAVSGVGASGFTVTWETDLPATSKLEYGPTRALGGSSTEDATPKTSHSVTVTGLPGLTPHYFRAVANASSTMPIYSPILCAVTAFDPDIIVDNPDGIADPDSAWSRGTGSNKYGPDYRFCSTSPDGTNSFAWRPNLPVAGNYEVYLWYPHGGNRSNAAPFAIHYDGNTISKTVNQQLVSVQWTCMLTPPGGVPFAAGTDGYITLTNAAPSGKVVMADGVKFRLVIPESAPPSVPDRPSAEGTSPESIALSWPASSDGTGVGGYKVFRDGVPVGATTSSTFVDHGLTPNKTYIYTISAYDVFGTESGQSAAASACTLAAVPTLANITADAPVGKWLSNPIVTFTSQAQTGDNGVDHYAIAWNTSPTHVWSDTEATWRDASISMAASSGAEGWYFHVRSVNRLGVAGASLDIGPFYYDGSAPILAAVHDGSAYTVDRTTLGASWEASDPESGISGYGYAIGTGPGKSDIKGWTDTTSTSVVVSVPEQPVGRTCYFTVKARNKAGAWSGEVDSDGIIVARVVDSIPEAKAQPVGTPVALQIPRPVTGVFANGFYVEEPTRTTGIYVECTYQVVAPGAMFAGIIGQCGGEKAVTFSEVGGSYSVTPVSPPNVTGKMLAGIGADGRGLKAWRWVKREDEARAKREFDVVGGADTLGLLVKLTGTVSSVFAGGFYLDDGAGFDDVEVPGPSGVRVELPSGAAAPAVGELATVVGISACREVDGELYRLLRVPSAGGVTLPAGR